MYVYIYIHYIYIYIYIDIYIYIHTYINTYTHTDTDTDTDALTHYLGVRDERRRGLEPNAPAVLLGCLIAVGVVPLPDVHVVNTLATH